MASRISNYGHSIAEISLHYPDVNAVLPPNSSSTAAAHMSIDSTQVLPSLLGIVPLLQTDSPATMKLTDRAYRMNVPLRAFPDVTIPSSQPVASHSNQLQLIGAINNALSSKHLLPKVRDPERSPLNVLLWLTAELNEYFQTIFKDMLSLQSEASLCWSPVRRSLDARGSTCYD
jgi:hypothetical protein